MRPYEQGWGWEENFYFQMIIPFAYAFILGIFNLFKLAYHIVYPPEQINDRVPTARMLADELKAFKKELFNKWIGSTLEFWAVSHTTICMKTTEVGR